MKELDTTQSEIIDLGSASEETKGDALFDIDVSGGRLSYATGMADDRTSRGARAGPGRAPSPHRKFMVNPDPDALAWCKVSERFIFLDIARDRYFALADGAQHVFLERLGIEAAVSWHQPPAALI